MLATCVLVSLVLSGCLGADTPEPPAEQADPQDERPDPAARGNEQSAPTETDGSLPVYLNQTMVLEGCDFWWGTLYLPPGVNPGRPPEGFSEPSNPLATSIATIRFHCDRLAIQELDRGPVSLMLEMHDNLSVGASCRATKPGTLQMALETVLVSDADAFNRTMGFGMPSFVATMAALSPTPPGVELMPDSWQVQGYPESTGHVERDDVTNPFTISPVRIFWHDGEHLWVGDVEFTGVGPAVVSRFMQGFFSPPMLAAQVADAMVLDTFWFVDGGAKLRIQQLPSGTCDG